MSSSEEEPDGNIIFDESFHKKLDESGDIELGQIEEPTTQREAYTDRKLL